jgi:hypothetical protein
MPKKKIVDASHEPKLSFKTLDASYVLTIKYGIVVAKYVGCRHKCPKTCVWVPKVFVSNVKGPVGGLLHRRRSHKKKHLQKARARTMPKLPIRELRSVLPDAPT